MKLALDLLNRDPEDEKIYFYSRAATDSLPLMGLASSKKLENRTACILEDAFDRNVTLEELTSPWLDSLDRTLKNKSSFLILTTRRSLQDLEPLSVGKISACPEDLEQVFVKHLQRFAAHTEGVDLLDEVARTSRERWPLLSRYLTKPAQINRFCFKLGELRGEVTDENLEALAREAAYIGQTSVRHSFGELGDNQKLYALLVVLFDGIERAALDDIYRLSVQHLREAGVAALRDEREIGLDDILEQIRARETETLQIVIEDTGFRTEVLRQVRNHRFLLYTLAMRLLALCEEHCDPEYWELRRAIGRALGRLAAQEKRGLDPISAVLEVLAGHEHGGVASVAGSILEQVCRDAPQLRSDVLARLHAWIESGDPDLMWAAGAATWRIYEGIGSGRDTPGQKLAVNWHGRTLDVIAALVRKTQQIFSEGRNERLQREVSSWIQQNRRCALHALTRILTASPLSAVGKLEEWLRTKPSEPIRRIANLACREALEQSAEEKYVPLPDNRAWLRLIVPVLSLDPDEAEAGDALLAALANWSHWSAAYEDEIYASLLRAAHHLSGEAARSLRSGLIKYWLTSESEAVRRQGRALLRRSHAMEGLPLRSLPPASALIALDASLEAMADPGRVRLARELIKVVACYAKVTVGHMGGNLISEDPKVGFAEKNLLPSFPRPRLLLPLIEEDPAEPAVVLVLAPGSILDLEDGQGQSWWPPLLVTSSDWTDSEPRRKGPPEEPSSTQPVEFTQNLDDLVTGLVRRLNAKPSLTREKNPPGKPTWVNLETLGGAGSLGSPDPAALMISDLLERSLVDFASCLRALRGWLQMPVPANLPIRSASAGIRALLRFHVDLEQSLPDTNKEDLLRLAFLLPPTDEGVAETVLETIFAWMNEKPWAERITKGGDLSMTWMRWFETLIPYHGRALDRWLSRRERAAKEADGTATRQALGWLRFRWSLGSSGNLPALTDGRKYGVFLLDASSSDPVSGADLAQLTSDLLDNPQLREIPCLVFRLGRKAPLAIPGEKLAQESILPVSGARLARLLGPILADLPAERILFVLVLSSRQALDATDWSESPWAPLIRLYDPTGVSALSEPFVRISQPYDKNVKEVDVILRDLKPLIAKGT